MDIPVIDCHTHIINGLEGIDKLAELKKTLGFDKINVLSISGMGDITQNLKCMLYKALYPDNSYIFGGLIHPSPMEDDGKPDYAEQAKRLIAMGFDGMKMIEGKPTVRKELGKPLDHPSYDEYYAYLEAEKIPLLFHVADPETFWNRETTPSWAIDNGWFYGDGTYPEYSVYYKEIDGVLEKFPRLKLILAHFYFLSDAYEKAVEFLEKWPEVSFDLTPGTEMYVNFSKNPDKWREFFVRYQDRILFGTDSCDASSPIDYSDMVTCINMERSFLELDTGFKVWDLNIKGVGLGKQILEKIYNVNFQKFVGSSPKPIDTELALEECERTIRLAEKRSSAEDILSQMKTITDKLKALK